MRVQGFLGTLLSCCVRRSGVLGEDVLVVSGMTHEGCPVYLQGTAIRRMEIQLIKEGL